ncbi:hypothetical protein GGH96_005713 [Coemansia sp. RSA 1972]|nr:hypothetical protein GGH96_005713 [Coemansia sp. RSA 1972]
MTRFNKLPPRILTRIFEYLFWTSVCGPDQAEQFVLPIGQFELLACLKVSHAWRKRAAGLFYRTAVVCVGTTSNVRLVLESGYAPKTTRLVVSTNAEPNDLAKCLRASEFVGYEWPSINTLYFYHPQNQKSNNVDQDKAIDDVNRYLLASMPNLKHIFALSGTSDSFGLFALDDLINERMPHLKSLTAVAQGALKLGFHGHAQLLTQLKMHTVALNNNESSDSSDDETENMLQKHVPLSVPRVYAESLVLLDIGPIALTNIWAPFFGHNEQSNLPDLNIPPNFLCLRKLRLVFGVQARQPSDTHTHRMSKHKNSPNPENSIYPLFPQLESLTVEQYPCNILLFLENFPRSQLLHLKLRNCPHHFYELSLCVFSTLQSACIDIPEAPHASKDQDEETWISKVFDSVSTLRSLSLRASTARHVDLPSTYQLQYLQHLDLSIGMRSVEVEKLLVELKRLRSLCVTITEVLSKTHEYLSRSMRPKKYTKRKYSRVLSTTLEQLIIRLVDLPHARQRRALAKTACSYTTELHAKYGEVVRVGYNQISVSNVDELRRILSSHKYPKSAHFERGLSLPPSVFSTSDPELNKMRRRQMGPMYSMPTVRLLEDSVIETGALSLMAEWDKQVGQNTVNYFYGFHGVAVDIIGLLTAILYESMRMHSAVSGYLPRIVPHTGATIMDYYLPPTTEICVSFSACHRNKHTWLDPHRFMPERFMGPDAELRKRDVLVFGSGVRMCAGRNLAWIELYTLLANVLRRYDFELPRDAVYGPHRISDNGSGPECIPGLSFTTFGPANPSRHCNVKISLAPC